MKVSYKEAKQRALKERDIWVRRLLCDPITTPLAYLLVRYTKVEPITVTAITFLLGVGAFVLFSGGLLLWGGVVYFLCFLSDSLDGKISRVLGEDDTYRGMMDFLLDGIVCLLVTVGLAINELSLVAPGLLLWMSIHYLDMRYTSATYRLKLQAGDTSTWMVHESSEGVWRLVHRFIKKTGTYPVPTVGEAVILLFVVGPILWHLDGVKWMNWALLAGILCTIPETIGAGLIAYRKAKELQ